MSTQVQFRRGTTAQHSAFTGANAEITVDTDKKVAVVHDGSTVGGFPLVSTTATQTLSNKEFIGNTTISGNLIPSSNLAFSLGSSNFRFKDLWLSGNTIYMSSATIEANATALILTNPQGGQFVFESSLNLNLNNTDANIGTLFLGNLSTNANIGEFYNYANSKIGTNTNSNLVVMATTTSTSTTTGALVVGGGVGVSGPMFVSNVTAGGITSNGTIQTATVNAATIGNSGATLVGTVSTASQPNITTLGGLTSFGAAFGSTIAQGNLTVVGNLTIQGNTLTIGSNNLTVQDSVIDLHTFANLDPLLSDDGRDIGIRFHYYKGSESYAFLGWENDTETLIYLQKSNETTSNITGTYGNVQFGSLLLSNTTAAISTTTGAFQVRGGVGVSGALYAGGIIDTTSNTQATSTLTGALQVTGGASLTTGNLYIGGSGGTAIVATGNILPSGNIVATNNIGSDTAWWNNFYGVATQARYADLAENYQADSNYKPGTVLSFGGSQEVTISTVSHDTAVAGVVSTNPAHLMNGALQGPNVVPLALQGRVPCQVRGPVDKGTLLVSSNIAGVAEAFDINKYQPGCVIGKSLGTIENYSIQTIEVVVGRI